MNRGEFIEVLVRVAEERFRNEFGLIEKNID